MILCVGGAHLDVRARLLDPAVLGSSNPAHTDRAVGGVAANVARSLAALGHEVALASVVGLDPYGDLVAESLRRDGVDVSLVERHPVQPTAAYTAVVGPDGELVIGLADMEVYDDPRAGWVGDVSAAAAGADVVVIDANLYGEVLSAVTAAADGPVVADPVSVAKAPRLAPVLDRIAVLAPDRAEAAALAGVATEAMSGVRRAAAVLRSRGVGTVLVTLGSDGVFFDDGDVQRVVPPIPPGRIEDVTGVGDALVAGYVHGLRSGAADPVLLGRAAASLALESAGSRIEGLGRHALEARAALGPAD